MSTHPEWKRRSLAEAEAWLDRVRARVGGVIKAWDDEESGYAFATLTWRGISTIEPTTGEVVELGVTACAEDQAAAMIQLSHQVAIHMIEVDESVPAD